MLNLRAAASASGKPNAYSFALAGLARLSESCTTLDEQVRNLLREAGRHADLRKDLLSAFREYLKRPENADERLFAVAVQFRLTPVEVLAVRLAMAAEEDLLIGHVLTHLQQPMAHSRPTIGLLAQAYGMHETHSLIHVLAQGNAVRSGLLHLCGDDLPSPERQVRIAVPNSLALQGIESPWPGVSPIELQFAVRLGKSNETRAAALGERLLAAGLSAPALIVRTGDALEGRAAAERICSHCAARPVLVQTDRITGIAPWLLLNGLIPVFNDWLGPGERKPIPMVPGLAGPLIVLSGPDGEFQSDHQMLIEWRIETPPPQERIELWEAAIHDRDLAGKMASEHRHSAGRIAALAAQVCESGENRSPVTYIKIRATARQQSAALGAFAELICDEVDDAALVVTPGLREELDSLVVRCRLREQFSASLGPSIRARYRPTVRALFVGPSGTGKTLAAAWLATRLGIPLYRVDLSATTSKYIGETEKNLSQLLARAEQNEVVLLFDEADALFGKRTDIQEANDRFANAQTNYLLQRMESYDGITVLTSNGRGRFDAAFSRRLDAILSFPLPGPEERRALWGSHLGAAHGVNSAELNRLAVLAELSGGQIRNAVLRGAVAAAQEGKTIFYRHVLAGVTGEYRKLSRQLPSELKQTEVPVCA